MKEINEDMIFENDDEEIMFKVKLLKALLSDDELDQKLDSFSKEQLKMFIKELLEMYLFSIEAWVRK